jgi:hypothetical protein
LTPVCAILRPSSARPPAEPFKNAHADGACQVLSIADQSGDRGWDAAMYEAKGQAELYVRNRPASEHNPPFIAVKETEYRLNALIWCCRLLFR